MAWLKRQDVGIYSAPLFYRLIIHPYIPIHSHYFRYFLMFSFVLHTYLIIFVGEIPHAISSYFFDILQLGDFPGAS